ncbi:alpha beta hydrolase fold protein [Favolaschia claudopus]|uniref:Alpha beta hydrolase fold protein n=1 Tax=Favolaschia claudopus TaxID=2862362 RepID=A0AAW0BGY0_9AGAR
MKRLGIIEWLKLHWTLIQIPFVLLDTFLWGRWSKRANNRPFRRIAADRMAYFILSRLSIRQLQAISGSSLNAYATWAEKSRVERIVDELGNDSCLMWLGSKYADHVVIYCHGGGFVGPLSDFQIAFWHRMQQALKTRGVKLDVAILQYSTYPAAFPTQMNQLHSAIRRVTSMGVPPSKICLGGDSAGGNIILQLLGNLLHPSSLIAPSISNSVLSNFAGICLISPWTLPSSIRDEDDSFDLVPAGTLSQWMDTYLAATPEAHHVYVQHESAPQNWYDGLDKIAQRILITAGRNEVLYGSIVELFEAMEKAHPDVEMDVQENGVHCDVMFDIAAKSKIPHSREEIIANWLHASFELAVNDEL